MNDSTQTLIRSVLKIGAGYLVAKGLADKDLADELIAGGMAIVAVAWGLAHRTAGKPPVAGQPPRAFLVLLAALPLTLVYGCSTFSSEQAETHYPDGRVTITSEQRVSTLFDANAAVTKLRASRTDKTQGLTVGAINEESSTTNAFQGAGAMLGAALRQFATPK